MDNAWTTLEPLVHTLCQAAADGKTWRAQHKGTSAHHTLTTTQHRVKVQRAASAILAFLTPFLPNSWAVQRCTLTVQANLASARWRPERQHDLLDWSSTVVLTPEEVAAFAGRVIAGHSIAHQAAPEHAVQRLYTFADPRHDHHADTHLFFGHARVRAQGPDEAFAIALALGCVDHRPHRDTPARRAFDEAIEKAMEAHKRSIPTLAMDLLERIFAHPYMGCYSKNRPIRMEIREVVHQGSIITTPSDPSRWAQSVVDYEKGLESLLAFLQAQPMPHDGEDNTQLWSCDNGEKRHTVTGWSPESAAIALILDHATIKGVVGYDPAKVAGQMQPLRF